jgi:hypothetical protein
MQVLGLNPVIKMDGVTVCRFYFILFFQKFQIKPQYPFFLGIDRHFVLIIQSRMLQNYAFKKDHKIAKLLKSWVLNPETKACFGCFVNIFFFFF